jgi:predicted nucleic acid-binding protein
MTTVLVDTSAWIEFLRGTGSPEHRFLRSALQEERPLAWTEPVLLELTVGARSDRRARELRAMLAGGELLAVQGLADWAAAASLWRAARERGLTVRSTVDCLIAAVAIRTDTPVLARDRDYGALAQVSALEIVAAP